jgi:hypothetical protein
VSSQAVWELASGSAGALLVSPFIVEWGCYAWAEGVEKSEFCLFLVAFPARHISSISPRFYFRKHIFRLLPLVAILESPVLESIHVFRTFRVCLMKLGALTLGAYRLIIVISFWCISPFISMECPFLSCLINVGLKSTLSEISIATLACFQGPLAGKSSSNLSS